MSMGLGTLKSLLKLCFPIFIFALQACSDSSEPVDAIGQIDSPPMTEASTGQPNIIFILVDDMGWNDVGYHGSEIATPNLDQLALDGIQLHRNYVYPVCSSTRAALLTGQSPFKYGIDGPVGDHAGMPLNIRTMPEYLKALGYQTHMVGKWHLGLVDPAYFPFARGFDSHYGFLGGWVDYYTHVYNGGLDWQRDGVSVREEGYTTELLTAEALRLIESKSSVDDPFFLYLSYNAPHTPLQPLEAPTGLNESLTPEDRYVYAEMVTDLDADIGKIVETLEAMDLLQDTLVIFSSDNGGATGSGASNGVLREGKGGAFEGGLRVPGLVWWQGHIEGGRLLEQPILAQDWLPTLFEAIGEQPSNVVNIDGQSMWPAIADGELVERLPATIGVAGSVAAFDWPWKLVDHTARGPNGERTIQLFNVEADPREIVDLALVQPEIYQQLNALIEAIPEVESLRSVGPPPEVQFRNEEGGWNFEFTALESRSPWADSSLSD
jgi:arylsulfatase A-like enzyme